MTTATLEVPTKLTWRDLVREEPRLAELEARIKKVRAQAGESFCANAQWYGYSGGAGFKSQLLGLVGWHARNAKLRSSRAYDVGYAYLYGSLPNCNGCGCF